MAQRPGVVRHGTAKDAADVAVGYTASGASEHSRHAAHGSKTEERPGAQSVTGADREEGRQHGRGKRSRWQIIQENHRRIAKIASKMKTEKDPEKLATLRKNYAIKSAFLSGLHSESGTKIKVRIEPIETIPGEDDFDPWDKVGS